MLWGYNTDLGLTKKFKSYCHPELYASLFALATKNDSESKHCMW